MRHSDFCPHCGGGEYMTDEETFDTAMELLREKDVRSVKYVETEGNSVCFTFDNGDIFEVNLWTGSLWFLNEDGDIIFENTRRF